jgi:MraZ protein
MQAMSELGPVLKTDATQAPQGRATFYGTHYHKVSGKNQVAIPKNMKRVMDEARQDALLLMRVQEEKFLRLYTKTQFDQKLDEMKRNPEQAKFIEYMARMAEPVEPDSQGRFVLPGKWMDALNIRDEVAFCGAFTFIKIWPAEVQREADKADAAKMAESGKDLSGILDL